MPADVARTGSRGMAGAPPLASWAVGVAAGDDGAASEPATEPSHLLWPSQVFTTLSLCFEIKNLELELIESYIWQCVPSETLHVSLMSRNGIPWKEHFLLPHNSPSRTNLL